MQWKIKINTSIRQKSFWVRWQIRSFLCAIPRRRIISGNKKHTIFQRKRGKASGIEKEVTEQLKILEKPQKLHTEK
jgi:hypothetical protein